MKSRSIEDMKIGQHTSKKILVAHLEVQNTASGTQGITDSNTDVAHLESEIKYLKKLPDEVGQI